MSTKRLFVSVDLPQPVLHECERISTLLRKQELFKGRFVPIDKVHITLAFLGAVTEEHVTAIVERLERVKWNPFTAQLGSVDLLTSGKRIKVVFVQVVSKELVDLAQEIQAALADLCPQEERSFVSHLTLARVKQVPDVTKLVTTVNQLEVEPVEFLVDAFQLKESVLTPEGPVYTTLLNQKMH